MTNQQQIVAEKTILLAPVLRERTGHATPQQDLQQQNQQRSNVHLKEVAALYYILVMFDAFLYDAVRYTNASVPGLFISQ